ncbi:hypothetical protein Tco_0918541 [Tanacetum coccineum]
MHDVPPPMIGNYMPSRPDIKIDYSQFTYGPKQSQTSKSKTQTSNFDTCESDCSVETQEPLPEPTVNEPKVVSQPKVLSEAPIIKEYESDSKDEHVSLPTKEQETPSFANQQVKSPRETIKNQFTHSKNLTVDKKGLGYGFTARASVLTRTGKILVNTARASGTNRSTRANHNAGIKDNIDAGDSEKEDESAQDYFILPIWSSYSSTVKRSTVKNAGEKPTKHPDLKTVEKPIDKEDQVFLDKLERLKRQEQDANDAAEALRKKFAQETKDLLLQAGAAKTSSTNIVNTASTLVSTASPYGGLSFTDLTNPDPDDSEIPALEDIYNNPTNGIFTNSSYDDEGAVADFTNLEPVVNVSPIPTSRINYIHPSTLILGDPQSAVQIRSKVTKSSGAHAFVSYIQKQRKNNL